MTGTSTSTIDANEIKRSARGRWPEILSTLGGIPRERLDGKHHPCPKCGGTDRFSAFKDFADTGGILCRHCFTKSNGDGLAALQWATGESFPVAVNRLADYLGISTNGNGRCAIINNVSVAGKGHNGHQAHQAPTVKTFATVAEALAVYERTLGAPDTWYEYTDTTGQCVGFIYRWDTADGKEIRPISKIGDGWGCCWMPEPRPLYRAHTLGEAPQVYVTEGEKAADSLVALGMVASTSPSGSKAASKADWAPLAGKTVYLLPDADEPGAAYAATVARILGNLSPPATVRIVTLPGLPDKGDAFDFIQQRRMDGASRGEIRAEIEALAAGTEPESTLEIPESASAEHFQTGEIVNSIEVDNGKRQYLTMTQILDQLEAETDRWPRRVGTELFVDDEKHGVSFLQKPPALFGWAARRVGKVTWHKGAAAVGQAEVFAELQRTAPQYISVENTPHEPPMDGHYYTCGKVASGDGAALNDLLDRFAPETAVDRELILSIWLTSLWGGAPSTRPAYVITADAGRGMGKSKLVEFTGELFGGILSFSQHEEIGKIKTRLLSPDALTRRIALLDNVKSLRFSWAELEALITASTIGGHRLYAGEGTRPNTLVWFITLNGASLSTDMAQRAVVVKLRKPDRSAGWEENTRAFIQTHRQAIIGDLAGVLRGPANPLAKFTRWASWEKDVLQRLPAPQAAQDLILERQAEVDVEAEESSLVADYFADQLRRLEYDVDAERVFIPSQIAARWFNWATNQPTTGVIGASRQLAQLIGEKRMNRLAVSTGRSWGRGFLWVGADWQGMHTATDLQERITHRRGEG